MSREGMTEQGSSTVEVISQMLTGDEGRVRMKDTLTSIIVSTRGPIAFFRVKKFVGSHERILGHKEGGIGKKWNLHPEEAIFLVESCQGMAVNEGQRPLCLEELLNFAGRGGLSMHAYAVYAAAKRAGFVVCRPSDCRPVQPVKKESGDGGGDGRKEKSLSILPFRPRPSCFSSLPSMDKPYGILLSSIHSNLLPNGCESSTIGAVTIGSVVDEKKLWAKSTAEPLPETSKGPQKKGGKKKEWKGSLRPRHWPPLRNATKGVKTWKEFSERKRKIIGRGILPVRLSPSGSPSLPSPIVHFLLYSVNGYSHYKRDSAVIRPAYRVQVHDYRTGPLKAFPSKNDVCPSNPSLDEGIPLLEAVVEGPRVAFRKTSGEWIELGTLLQK